MRVCVAAVLIACFPRAAVTQMLWEDWLQARQRREAFLRADCGNLRLPLCKIDTMSHLQLLQCASKAAARSGTTGGVSR